MTTETSMVHYYARRAREYERIYNKPERQDDLRRLRQWIGQTFAGLHVLEAACGTGYWTEVVAPNAASVLAADINEEVLAIARSKSIDHGKVDFRLADAYALPDLSRQFNAGLAAFWWSHIPQARIREFLRGFHRLLSPGSLVVFLDNMYVQGSSTPISRIDSNGDTFQTRTLEDGSSHEVLKNFPTESMLRASVEGLASDVQIKILQYYWILIYRRL